MAKRKLILFGATHAVRVHGYVLTHDSDYEVAGYTVDAAYCTAPTVHGRPLVPFEEIERHFPPDAYDLGLPITYHHGLNRLRMDRFASAKAKGYTLARWVSSRAVTWPDLVVGENSFVHEGCVIQPGVVIGDNVIVAPGAMLGHDCQVAAHAFIGPRAALLGTTTVGERCVVGANATVRDGVRLGPGSVVGAAALVTRHVPADTVLLGTPAEPIPGTSDELAFLFAALPPEE